MRLDCGCGSGRRPAKDFDAYCDVIKPREGVVLPEPYYCCPMEDMSCFQDKEFDYVRCHHVIEHVEDPKKACTELIRIGKSGLISFPPPQAEMCYGRKDHNWHVFVDRHRLVFVPKFYESLGFPRSVAGGALNVDFGSTSEPYCLFARHRNSPWLIDSFRKRLAFLNIRPAIVDDASEYGM